MDRALYTQHRELEDSHWWFLGRWRIFSSLLDRYLTPLPPTAPDREVLDVGTGMGGSLDHLAAYGSVMGVEGDADAVAFCHERGHPDVFQATLPPIPLEADRFDLVTCLDVLEHVDRDQALLDDARRVLKPGGLCLISVPAFEWMWGRQDVVAHHKRRYRADGVRELMQGSGFEIVRLSYFNFLLFPPIAGIRLAARLSRRDDAERSDFDRHGGTGRVNAALARVFGSEAGLLKRRDLPFGVSIVAVGRKPRGAG